MIQTLISLIQMVHLGENIQLHDLKLQIFLITIRTATQKDSEAKGSSTILPLLIFHSTKIYITCIQKKDNQEHESLYGFSVRNGGVVLVS